MLEELVETLVKLVLMRIDSMKTIIAGGRDYYLTEADYRKLDSLRGKISEVVCGCARGADTCGEQWAGRNGIPVKRFPALGETYGKKAGHMRNVGMANYAEALVVFPGGNGTKHMLRTAIQKRLVVFDFRPDQEGLFAI